jgi:WhiB family redox-sensing transcriptional regulator
MASPAGLDWQDRAACKGADPELFFAPGPGPDGSDLKELAAERKRRESTARRICASCPVRVACLEWRLRFEHQRDGGIWGGLDEEQRWKLRKNRIRAAAAMRRAS